MSIEVTDHDGVKVVRPDGDLIEGAPLAGVVRRLVEEGATEIVVDLEAVAYANSSGLNGLVGASICVAERGGHLVAARATKSVGRMLEVSALDRFFHVQATIEEAVARLRDGSFRRSTGSRPAFLADLGLKWPFTTDEVRHAFHLRAKTAHPDAGGDTEAFVELQRMYESALAYVRKRQPSARASTQAPSRPEAPRPSTAAVQSPTIAGGEGDDDPDWALVRDAWPMLPPPLKAAIVAMIRADSASD